MTAFNYLLLLVALAAGDNSVFAVIRPDNPNAHAGATRSTTFDKLLDIRGGQQKSTSREGRTSAGITVETQPSFSFSVALPEVNVDFGTAIQNLWDLDASARLEYGTEYNITNFQESPFIRKKLEDVEIEKGEKYLQDKTELPEFFSVDEERWGDIKKRPTYATFIRLLDNYNALVGGEEKISNTTLLPTDKNDLKEIDDFLDAIMETKPMKYCQQYLLENQPDDVSRIPPGSDGKRVIPTDPGEFKEMLKKMWFQGYDRTAPEDVKEGDFIDSSGFEHVFVGELKSSSIGGMHNWIQMYLQQEAGRLDVYGYNADFSAKTIDEDDRLMNLKFRWKGPKDSEGPEDVYYRWKLKGSVLLGTSPEFEMALYTLAYLQNQSEGSLNTGDDIFTYTIKTMMKSGSDSKIAQAFAGIAKD